MVGKCSVIFPRVVACMFMFISCAAKSCDSIG
jgi:hypothetical protein